MATPGKESTPGGLPPGMMDQVYKQLSENFDLVPKSAQAPPPPLPFTSFRGRRFDIPDNGADSTPPVQSFLNRPPSGFPFVSTPNVLPYPTQFSSNPPKIPSFSGDEPINKGEVPYVIWRYEVQCMMNNPEISATNLLYTVRSSLRGSARMMVIPLGQESTLVQIMDRLDCMFSDASTKEDLMTEFFNSSQAADESVTSYACRLETLLQAIINKGQLPGVARNDILRHKFWTGLSSDMLRLQTRHKYDTLADYNQLLREIRKVEKEMLRTSTSSNLNSSSTGNVLQTTPFSKKVSVKNNTVTADSDVQQQFSLLEKKMQSRLDQFDTKLTSWENMMDQKINSKFDQILQKLDSTHNQQQQHQSFSLPPQPFSTNRGRGHRPGRYSGGNQASGYSQQDYNPQGSHLQPNSGPRSFGRGRGISQYRQSLN